MTSKIVNILNIFRLSSFSFFLPIHILTFVDNKISMNRLALRSYVKTNFNQDIAILRMLEGISEHISMERWADSETALLRF